jgi:HEAT repeat protein
MMKSPQKAWDDLIKLTSDEDRDVRHWAAYAPGSAFSHTPDKQKAWNNLHKLTTDKYWHIRVNANHSLGKVSIFKAFQAETDKDSLVIG